MGDFHSMNTLSILLQGATFSDPRITRIKCILWNRIKIAGERRRNGRIFDHEDGLASRQEKEVSP
jgi:hypothetical protein